MATTKRDIRILLGLAAICILGVFSLDPIAQDLAYHNFADMRPLWGVPNFGDVAGNAAFLVSGIAGLLAAWRMRKNLQGPVLWIVFFVGVTTTGIGSAYYHWAPDNHTLVWDRLPMTISFMSLFSLIIMERIDARVGRGLFPLFLVTGLFSVWYWDYTETAGAGDLRLYALVQFFPMLAILAILKMFPAGDGRTKYLLYTLGWYVAAKVLEYFDHGVFTLTQHAVSGHTLKHVAAAIGTAYMISYMKRCATAGERSELAEKTAI